MRGSPPLCAPSKEGKLITRSSQSIISVTGNRREDYLATGKAMARLTSQTFITDKIRLPTFLKLDDRHYLHT